MHADPLVHELARPFDRDLDAPCPNVVELPHDRGGAIRDDRLPPGPQRRREHPLPRIMRRAGDPVHTGEDTLEAPGLHAIRDLPVGQPGVAGLRASEQPSLLRRDRPQPLIWMD